MELFGRNAQTFTLNMFKLISVLAMLYAIPINDYCELRDQYAASENVIAITRNQKPQSRITLPMVLSYYQ